MHVLCQIKQSAFFRNNIFHFIITRSSFESESLEEQNGTYFIVIGESYGQFSTDLYSGKKMSNLFASS